MILTITLTNISKIMNMQLQIIKKAINHILKFTEIQLQIITRKTINISLKS